MFENTWFINSIIHTVIFYLTVTLRVIRIFTPIYRYEHTGSESLSRFPKVRHLISK